MKKIVSGWRLLLITGAVLGFTACEKSSGVPAGANNIAGVDYVIVSNAVSATADDAALAADQTNGIARGGVQLTGICGGAMVDTANGQSITIYYDSTTACASVIRSGSIGIVLNGSTGWSTKGGMITVTLYSVGVNDPVTGQNYSLSGTFTILNESGGVLSSLNNGQTPVIRRHQSLNSIQVTNNGTTTGWGFDRTRLWTALTVGMSKLMNVAQYTEASNGIECSGTTRYNQAFNNFIDSTVQTDTYICPSLSAPLMEPYKGLITETVNGLSSTIAYGDNNAGTYVGRAESCSSGLTYGYFITFVYANNTTQTGYVFWPYHL
jgi:hypothetical protein